jgi:hypothetical protein
MGMSVSRSLWIEAAVAAALSGIIALTLMGSVVLAPHDRVYGLPSDPLGEVWRLAQFDRGEIGLVGNGVSDQANTPSGVPLRRPADASQVLYDVPAALLARMVGPVLAYNTFVFLAFWTTGLAAYGAMRWLGIGSIGGALAAALFIIAPVHMVESQLHVALALVFMLPILLALGLRALDRPTWRRGALFGGSVGLCGYVTGYLFLEATTLAAGVAVAAGVRAVFDGRARPLLGRSATAASLAALAVLMPLLIVLALNRGSLAPELNRPVSDVAAFSLQARDYADPGSSNYIGLAGLGLAVLGLAAGRLSRTTRWTLAVVALVAFLVSLKPEFSLLGIGVPMPSKLVHSLVPYWRVFGRTAVVTALATAFLAGFLVDRLGSGRRLGVQLATVALAVLAIGDVVERPPGPAADLGRKDPLAEALSHGSGAVAEYPLFGFDNYQLGPYLLRQLQHRRPLLNGSIKGTTSADLASAASTPGAPVAREAFSLAGVRTLVAHPGVPAPPPTGFRREERLPDGTAVYAVAPMRQAAVASARGAYDFEAGPDGTPFQWLGTKAQIRAVARDARAVTLTFSAVSPEVPRSVRFGKVHREVATGPTRVEFCVGLDRDGTATVSISTEPASRRLPGGDSRVSGIGIYHLLAKPGCAQTPAGGQSRKHSPSNS